MGKLSIGLVFEAESDCTLHVVGNSFPSCFQQRGWSGIPAEMYRRTLVMIDNLIPWSCPVLDGLRGYKSDCR